MSRSRGVTKFLGIALVLAILGVGTSVAQAQSTYYWGTTGTANWNGVRHVEHLLLGRQPDQRH